MLRTEETPSRLHDPVMLSEVLDMIALSEETQNTFIDATLGLGGHAEKILEKMHHDDTFIGIDRDPENLERARSRLVGIEGGKRQFFHGNFSEIGSILAHEGIETIRGFLYDLGVSSVHFDEDERGFSIRGNGPLDMRFDRTKGKTAQEILHNASEEELVLIFREYGEEPKARFIAHAIHERRKKGIPIETTHDLVKIIEESSHDPKSKIRVFQALRIKVNQEFDHIRASLHEAIQRLEVGGRIIVITFHSLEDRLVKHLFAEYEKDTIDEMTGNILTHGILRRVTKKPLIPREEEMIRNPRSRSAKMRIVEKRGTRKE